MSNADSRTGYFAYGSNLWIEQMIRRVGPSCVDVAPEVAHLSDYRLAFNMRGESGETFANIRSPGAGVWGVVYRCDAEALAQLDEYESGYERVAIQVTDRAGQARAAVAYVAQEDRVCDAGAPAEAYLERILVGARQHGLPPEYVAHIEALAASAAAER